MLNHLLSRMWSSQLMNLRFNLKSKFCLIIFCRECGPANSGIVTFEIYPHFGRNLYKTASNDCALSMFVHNPTSSIIIIVVIKNFTDCQYLLGCTEARATAHPRAPIVNMHCATFALNYIAFHCTTKNWSPQRSNAINTLQSWICIALHLHWAIMHCTTFTIYYNCIQLHCISHQNTLSYFFVDKRLNILTPALPVVPGTNFRYVPNMHLHCIMSHGIALD